MKDNVVQNIFTIIDVFYQNPPFLLQEILFPITVLGVIMIMNKVVS